MLPWFSGMNGSTYNTKRKKIKLVIGPFRFKYTSMRSLLCLLMLFQLSNDCLIAQDKGAKELSQYEKANSEYLLIESEKFILIKDYERALANLEQAIEIDRNNHAAYFKKAEVLIIGDKLIEAQKAINQAIVIENNNLYYYVLAAEIAKSLEQPDQAADIYENMIKNSSGYERYGTEIIELFNQVKRYREAIEMLNECISFYPNYPELYLKKAEIELKQGKEKTSRTTIAQGFDKFPKDPTLLLLHIQNLKAEGKQAEAVLLLENSDPTFSQAKLLLIELYNSEGNLEEARKLILESFQQSDFALESKILALSLLIDNHQIENMMLADSLQQSLANDYQDEALVHENGGLMYEELAYKSDFEKSLYFLTQSAKSYKKAGQINPANFNAWLKVFEFEIAQHQWSELAEDVEYLLDLYPNQSILYYYYSEAFKGMKDYEEADILIDQGLKMAGRSKLLKSLLLAQKARISVEKEELDQADELFNQSLNLNDIDERAIYYYGDWLAEVNPQAAEELLLNFKDQIGKGNKWNTLEVKVLFFQQQYEEAKEKAEELIESISTRLDGPFFELYGDVLFKLGMSEEALMQWRKALTLGGFSEKLENKIENEAN